VGLRDPIHAGTWDGERFISDLEVALSTQAWSSYGSTEAFSTMALGSVSAGYQQQLRQLQSSQLQQQKAMQQASDYQRQQVYNRMGMGIHSAPTVAVSAKQEPKKGFSMVEEVRSYIREYKDWIFTIAIIAIVDHFFLDGALKEKLAGALGKKLDNADGKA